MADTFKLAAIWGTLEYITRLISIESQPKKVVVAVVVVVVVFVVDVLVVVVNVSHRKPIFRVWSKLSQLLYVVSAVGVDIL